MTGRFMNVLVAVGCASVGLSVLSGCVMTPPVGNEMFAPDPGSYYVDQIEGKLHYYRLAEQRGERGEWLRLYDEASWYQGPGFYLIDEQGDWSLDENAVGLTLDEAIQLHDPQPAAPPAG